MKIQHSFLNEKKEYQWQMKQVVYTACFVFMCFIDQIRNNSLLIPQLSFANMTGICIGLIILIHFPLREFFGIPYAIWTILFTAGVLGMRGSAETVYQYHMWQWYTGAANVWLYGMIAVRLLLGVLTGGERPKRNRFFLAVWLLMMVGMILSESDSVWPLWFLVMFGCFYFTEFSKTEVRLLLKGALNGIIIAFFLLQGFGSMFRAYEIETRYTGIYSNSNMNALFYLVAGTAILAKLYWIYAERASLPKKIFWIAMCGLVSAFLLLPIGRTSLMLMGVEILLLNLMILRRQVHRAFLRFFLRLAAVGVSVILFFPAAFYLARWIQPEYGTSMIYSDDDYREERVRAKTPEEEQKYIELDVFAQEAFGRFLDILDSGYQERMRQGRRLLPMQKVYAAEEEIADLAVQPAGTEEESTAAVPEPAPLEEMIFPTVQLMPSEEEGFVYGSGSSPEDPVFMNMEGAFRIRWGVYRLYLSRLNFAGHKTNENGLWLMSNFYASHAHDLFLQMFFNFGYITGALFVVFAVSGLIVILFRSLRKRGDSRINVTTMLFLLLFVGFGLFEIDWRVGHLPFTMYFMMQYFLLRKA